MSSPTHSSRTGTVALIVRFEGSEPALVTSLSDDGEISTFEHALETGEQDPLKTIQEMRERIAREDEEFGNYIEELLSQPAVRPEIVEHGVQWLKSKIRIEEFQKTEKDATQTIALYAYKIFKENPWRQEFLLAAPSAKVKIRVFTLPCVTEKSGDSEAA